ncbi:hypothetical protein PIB30_116206, partial [Stylosanthes scabra]|nr:hypothetical protein [Stylosanthes scabra]
MEVRVVARWLDGGEDELAAGRSGGRRSTEAWERRTTTDGDRRSTEGKTAIETLR